MKDETQKGLRFMPFQPKENMLIAPVCRRTDFLNMSSQEKEEFMRKLEEYILNPVGIQVRLA